MTQTLETQNQPESAAPSRKSSRKSILALSVFALGLNASAAVYTMSPTEFALPDISRLAELLPQERPHAPIPDPVVAALNDIQSVQQQHATALQENVSSLQQNAALLQQDSTTLAGLRQSITDERVDIKKITAQLSTQSAQLSTLMAKVDLLQSAIAPEITSSIPKGRARNRLYGIAHKKMVRWSKPAGPISVGGAPLTTAPAQSWNTQQSPEG